MGISGMGGVAGDKVCEYIQRQAEILISSIESVEKIKSKEQVVEETEA